MLSRVKMEKCYNFFFINQFQKFNNLPSYLINWKISIHILLLICKYLNFVKKMLSETCTSQGLSRVKKEKCHNSVIYEPISKFLNAYHHISAIESFLCSFFLLIPKIFEFC